MADPIDIDPTRDDTGAAEGGAAGGGDDDTQDYNLPGGQTDSPEEQRRKWYQRGARPKDPYAYQRLPHDDKGTPMSTLPPERTDYLPLQRTLKKLLSRRIMTAAERMRTVEVELHFPTMGHSKVEVRYISKERGGSGDRSDVKMRNKTKWYPLFKQEKDANGKYVLRKDLSKEITKALGPYKSNAERIQ